MLIIEDESLFGNELKRYFSKKNWDVVLARDLDEARMHLLEKQHTPLIVLADMNLPDGNSLDLLDEIRKKNHTSEWIFLTGFGEISDSVRAMQLGAHDFLEKPCDRDRLDVVVSSARRSALAQRRITSGANQEAKKYTVNSFVGRSQAAKKIREMLTRLTQTTLSTLIISGESGTGKGLVARIIHYSGQRWRGPMIELNCAALPKDLLESELFGHETGAFTGAKGRRRGLIEQAHEGTLFLDEIGEMPVDLQSKLLKAIEDRRVRRLGGEKEIEVDVQILSATHRNLRTSIENGEFREDLYHRLNVFDLELPPLRNRLDDLEELVPQILSSLSSQLGKPVKHIPELVWKKLREHQWPGNVRELRNVLERALLFSDDGVLSSEWLQLHNVTTQNNSAKISGDVLTIPLDGSVGLDDIERLVIEEMLKLNNNNVTATANALSSTRETIRYRIKKYRLDIS